ncbi:MAG: bifunctional riboflavin kinase/FAD synthetase [Bdellovibrionota bacterium]|jgi:riboflavin kinase/FMN adenylyltransferase
MVQTLVVRGTTRLPQIGTPVVATIGSFDGLHLGHLALLSRVLEIKNKYCDAGEKATSIAISFHPHPAVVLGKNPHLKLITSLRQRLEILSEYGIDILYMVHFTPAFSRCTALDFINKVLINELNVETLVVGEDAAFGYGREGDVPFLSKKFAELGRSLSVVSQILVDDMRISSERIRGLLRTGAVKDVKPLLGRNFILDSYVVSGEQVGQKIGFPTANLKENEQIVPRDGVYLTQSHFLGETYDSITNIGFCPTFKRELRSVETHFLTDKVLNLYSKRIQVEFLDRLRDEVAFADQEELKRQIKIDLERAKKFFLAR